MTDAPSLSVVIPAYNEEKRLPPTLDRAAAYFDARHPDWEPVVVDDGSSDRTADVAEAFLRGRPRGRVIRLPANRGKGGALRAGMQAARGEWVLFMDADLSTPLEEFEKMRRWFETHAVVIGSRKVAGSEILESQPRYRVIMGQGFTVLANLILLSRFTDFTCGFKVFRRDAAQEVFGRAQIDGWGYDAEILFLARRRGFRVREVPVRWRNDPQTRVRLLSATIRSFFELLAVRWNDLLGVYRRPARRDPVLAEPEGLEAGRAGG